LGLNVVALCHAKEEDDGQGKQVRLAVKGGTTDIIYRSADMMGYMYMNGKKRVINFNPTQLHIGKNTAGIPVVEIPDVSAASYDNFIVEKVNTPYLQKMTQKSEAQIEFNEKMASYQAELSGLESPDDFGEFFTKMAEEKSPAIKAQVKKLLGVRMKELNLRFDRESGGVIPIEKEEKAFVGEPKEVLSETYEKEAA
jgi:hypothetical protein